MSGYIQCIFKKGGKVMSGEMTLVFFNIFIVLVLLIVQLLIPNVTRKNILLGVKIPEDQLKNSRVKEIIKKYRIETSILGTMLLSFGSILMYRMIDEKTFTILVFVYIALFFLVYLRWNKKVKALKIEMQWDQLTSNTVAVETNFSKEKRGEKVLSPKWFLLPLGIVLINFILVYYRYPFIPEKIPTHWDLMGNADAWKDKSIWTAFSLPFTQLFLTLMMYASYHFMMKSKKRVDLKNPEISIKKNIKFRRIWGIFFLVSATLLVLQFTYINLMILGIVGNIKIFNYATIFIAGTMIVSSIVIGVKVGQGGDRLKLEEEKLEGNYDIEDDRYWKLGNTIYYNKEDPSLIVEKRVGIGWTVNAGRTLGMVILALPFVILLWVFAFI